MPRQGIRMSGLYVSVCLSPPLNLQRTLYTVFILRECFARAFSDNIFAAQTKMMMGYDSFDCYYMSLLNATYVFKE